jgi:hypothetical protein
MTLYDDSEIRAQLWIEQQANIAANQAALQATLYPDTDAAIEFAEDWSPILRTDNRLGDSPDFIDPKDRQNNVVPL